MFKGRAAGCTCTVRKNRHIIPKGSATIQVNGVVYPMPVPIQPPEPKQKFTVKLFDGLVEMSGEGVFGIGATLLIFFAALGARAYGVW